MQQYESMIATPIISDNDNNASQFQLAYKQSLGFFDDISDREWHMLQNKARKVYPNTKLGNPREGPQRTGLWFQAHYEPDFACRHEQRIGTLGDGGKWVCDPHRISDKKDCLVYSVGSNGDASFEAAILNDIGQHCEIHVFDFGDYEKTVQQQAPGSQYHQWGIGNRTDLDFKLMTLTDTVQRLGHVNRTVDIFKIDCEGCELYSFQDWLNAPIMLRQVLVEVHGPRNDIANPFTSDMFESFYKAGYVIFHKEPNIAHWGPIKCVEYALLKLSKDFIGV